MQSYNLAIEFAHRALKANNQNAFAYYTLAEAYATKQDEEGFFNNLELALKYGSPSWEQLDEVVLDRYSKTTRFKDLVKKYQKT